MFRLLSSGQALYTEAVLQSTELAGSIACGMSVLDVVRFNQQLQFMSKRAAYQRGIAESRDLGVLDEVEFEMARMKMMRFKVLVEEEKQQQQQQQRAVRQLGLAWRGSEPICSFFSLVNAGAGGNLLLVQFGVV